MQANAKYFPSYKCPLCDELLHNNEPLDIPYTDLTMHLFRFVQHQQLAGNPYLHQVPQYIPHACKDGSVGLAFFAGFKVATK